MNIFNNKMELLDIEDFCFILFIIASVIDINGNEKARKFLINQKKLNNDLRNQYLLASFLILIVFFIFFLRNLNNLNNLSPSNPEYGYALARYIGSLLIVIGQCLTIFYYSNTTTFSKT